MNKSYNVTIERTETHVYRVNASNADEAEILAIGSAVRSKIIPSVSSVSKSRGDWEFVEAEENKSVTRNVPIGTTVKGEPGGTVSPCTSNDTYFPIPRGYDSLPATNFDGK